MRKLNSGVHSRERFGLQDDRWSRDTEGECSILGAAASIAHGLKKAKSTRTAGLSTAETAGIPQIPVLRFCFKVHRAKKEKKQQQE